MNYGKLGQRKMLTAQSVLSPEKALQRIGLVLAGSLLAGVLFPYLVAVHGNTLDNNQIIQKIEKIIHETPPSKKTSIDYLANAIKEAKAFDVRQRERTAALEQIDSTMFARIEQKNNQFTELHQLKAAILAENQEQPKFFFRGYYDPVYVLLWPTSLFSLGCLVLIAGPDMQNSPRRMISKQFFIICLAITAITHGPTIARNFAFYKEGRTIFGFANYDIQPASFFCQETMYLLVMILVAYVWVQWIHEYHRQVDFCLRNSKQTMAKLRALNYSAIENVTNLFVRWQICSILLAGGFFMFSVIYWDMVIVQKDQRYIAHAVVMHLLWLLTWVLLSLPLYVAWTNWRASRAEAICELSMRPRTEKEDSELILKALVELEPIGSLNFIASASAALGSIVLPFIQAHIK